MDILFASPELAPLLKVGGIAEGTAGLARALTARGHRVTVALPYADQLDAQGIELVRRPTPIMLGGGGGGGEIPVGVLAGRLDSGVELVLLDIPGDFSALGVYGDDIDERPDNARRFGLFARGVVELAARRERANRPYHILHAHEWPAAPIPYLLHARGGEGPRVRSVLTIHNLAHQGIFPREALTDLALGPEHFSMDRLEFYGRVNLLKGGIMAADVITTVSTTYAREILGPASGELLDGVLRAHQHKLFGIVNGIDLDLWNPKTDPALSAPYDADDPRDKERCKRALLREIGFETTPDAPLLVSLGRVVAQKGSDVLAAALPELCAMGARVAIAGGGEPALERGLAAAAAAAPGCAAYLGPVSEPRAHRLLAAADLVLMPSRFEPCGIVQMQAQRYGALPVARRTGGLADTIEDMSPDLERGTGFLYDGDDAGALVRAARRALEVMASTRRGELVRRVMRLDVGWTRPAHRYEQIYRAMLQQA